MQASTNISSTRKKRLHLTEQSKRSHVHAFKSSNQTMTDYCKNHSIPISTFSNWFSKHSKKRAEAFIPAHISTPPPIKKAPPMPQKAITTQAIEICRGDLKVVLPALDLLMAIEIIKGVLLCN